MESLSDCMPYYNLANAIIKLAARDYKKALRKIMKDPLDEDAWIKKLENERFFKSDWYKRLTNISSYYLIHRIQKEVGYID